MRIKTNLAFLVAFAIGESISAENKPTDSIIFPIRLHSFSVDLGIQKPHLQATGNIAAFLNPFGMTETNATPVVGLGATIEFFRILSMKGGLRYRSFYLSQSAHDIELNDEPFPHALEIEANFQTIEADLAIAKKLNFKSLQFEPFFGVFVSNIFVNKIDYIIDGEVAGDWLNQPYNSKLSWGGLAGLELTHRWKHIALGLRGEWTQSKKSFLDGMQGDLSFRSLSAGLVFAYLL